MCLFQPGRARVPGGNGRLLDEWGQRDHRVVAEYVTACGDRAFGADEHGEQQQQLHLIQCDVRGRAGVIPVLPSGYDRRAGFQSREGVRRDAAMRVPALVRHRQETQQCDGVLVGQRVEVALVHDVVAVQHQDRSLAGVGHAVDLGGGQARIAQSQNHRHMVLGRLSRRAVAPHGDAGEPDPLPQLFDVARRARLAVQSGDDEGPSPIIHGVVQSRSFDQIVVEGRGEGAMGQVDVHAALQRGDMQSDAVERLHEILAPCALVLGAGCEPDQHADQPAYGQGHDNSGHGVDRQQDQDGRRDVEDVPSPFDRRSCTPRPRDGQQCRGTRVEVRQQSRSDDRARRTQRGDKCEVPEGRHGHRYAPDGR